MHAALRVVTSTSAASRLGAVSAFLSAQSPASETLVVAASRGAADDLVRGSARARGATFGVTRFSLTELAARAAAVAPAAGTRRAVCSRAGAEAIAARAVFEALGDGGDGGNDGEGELTYFTPVASTPGFPRALARTLHELRLAAVSPERLLAAGPAAADIGRLLARMEAELERAQVHDRAALFRVATASCEAGALRWAGLPLILLDVPLDSAAERAFVAALIGRAPAALVTIPDGDERTGDAMTALGATIEALDDAAPSTSDLWHLRRHVFTSERPPIRARAGDVGLFSAPGEGREALEIVRRALDEAARGVPFDEMAVFLRTPQQHLGLLEHAADRAGVPMYFNRGTRRPDPAGRAFVALLSAAVEGLSAKRFDEYLSLGQVPSLGAPGRPAAPVPPADDLFGLLSSPDGAGDDSPEAATAGDDDAPGIADDDDAIVAGTLRSPWKWEELIVESAVVGGRDRLDGKARWRRRLDGLAADYRLRLDAIRRDEPESPRAARYERDLRNLVHLRRFALPIVDQLAEWPREATWGDWLARFDRLAVSALHRPLRVRRLLADLRPMAAVGPVTLDEARDVLRDRLITLDWDPPAARYGRLFVGTPHQARGRSFRVVFVPGLAERIVPQRPREDPLLLDERRRAVEPALIGQEARGAAERLLLKIALGAAAARVYLSYPRMDIAETRARVPSFYALDVVRAMTGGVPDYQSLADDAAEEGGATLAWPAPVDPARAVDDLEHDLAILKPLLDAPAGADVKGRAHYLLGLNDALRRSVRSRYARDKKAWSGADGPIRVDPGAGAALAAHRLNRRPYSLSALQRFAACPYQFLLSTIHRLEPWEEPEPLLRMDPLTRGSLFHRVQTEFYRERQAAGALPVTPAGLGAAIAALHVVLDRVAGEYAEQLVPAIDRVWRDEIDELRRDLGIWVQRLAAGGPWVPEYFEFSFGLGDEGRDPRSLPDPILVDGRFILRGSVDLIERRAAPGGAGGAEAAGGGGTMLRVTDHKTGKNRAHPDLVVGGGATLQPVLYSVAIEQGLGTPVSEGRLFYCTTAGGFAEHTIRLDEFTRRQGLEVLAIVDRAVERGFLAAAPARDACRWCDFRAVCGPREEERAAKKHRAELGDLLTLRSMR